MTRRLRIVFVADTVEGLGGGVVSADRFVRALRERHEVTLLAAGPPAEGKVVFPGFQLPIRAMRPSMSRIANSMVASGTHSARLCSL